MSTQMLAAVLAHTPLFAGLTPDERQQLARAATDRRFARGETVFGQGEPAAGMFVVMHGQVKVFQLTPGGHEVVLHLVRPGETLAEAAVFRRGAYPAQARAMKPSRLLFLPAQVLLQAILQNPDLALRMLASLSNRLREFAGMLGEQQSGTAVARLSGWLLRQSGDAEGNVRLEMSRETLASLLGLTRETLSRSFSRLRAMGLIAMNRREIRLLDPEGLRALTV